MDKFIFFSEKSEICSGLDTKIVIINKSIRQKNELFHLYSLELNFPSYFGNNWDALYDCLIDLSWIKNRTIFIIHEDIPLKSISIEQKKYIELLCDLITSWQGSEIHNLNVYFPEKCKKEIEGLLVN